MGQPIHLTKNGKSTTVYGNANLSLHLADGWKRATDQPSAAPPPAEIDATDSAIELAAEHGIDLSEVEGTGKDGRIILSDVQKLTS